jgi:serine/threonine protein kinase
MTIDAVRSLVGALQRCHVLEAAQLREVTSQLQAQYTDPRQLLRELVRRDWVTPFQANQLLQTGGRDLVLGPYVLLSRIGDSPMGQVYKARHRLMNRLVALTVFRPELLAKPEAVERFYNETQAVSQLTHSHILHAYDAGPIGQTHFFAMEFVEGIDLEQLVEQSGPLPLSLAVESIRQAGLGLQHAHERGMTHHDLKPADLLITRTAGGGSSSDSRSWRSLLTSVSGGGPLLKIRNLGLTLVESLPESAEAVRSADYGAPEAHDPDKEPDIRSDIYSLGCCFYFALTGKAPFPGGSAADKIRRHRTEEPVPLPLVRKDVPPSLASILTKMMAKRPESRYQSPGDLVQALTRVTI